MEEDTIRIIIDNIVYVQYHHMSSYGVVPIFITHGGKWYFYYSSFLIRGSWIRRVKSWVWVGIYCIAPVLALWVNSALLSIPKPLTVQGRWQMLGKT